LEFGSNYTFRVHALTADGASANTIDITSQTGQATIDGAAVATAGEPYTLDLTTTAGSGLDAADLVWHIDWGDGGSIQTVTGHDMAEHTYASGGLAYTISASAATPSGTGSRTFHSTLALSTIDLETQAESAKKQVISAFEYVYNNVKFEPYAMLRKGWQAT